MSIMNDSLLSERLVSGRKAVEQGRTVSCSWSTSSEDGEVDDPTGISLITALTPGGRRLMNGSSRVEAGVVS